MSDDIVWGIWTKDCIGDREGWLLNDYGEPLGPMTYQAAMEVVRRLWFSNFRSLCFSPKVASSWKHLPSAAPERPPLKKVRSAPAPQAVCRAS